MGLGGLRADFLSHSDKVNAGAKPAKCTSAANAHRRVLGVRSVLFFCRFRFGCLKELSLANRFSIPCLNAISARLQTKSDRKLKVFFSLSSRKTKVYKLTQ